MIDTYMHRHHAAAAAASTSIDVDGTAAPISSDGIDAAQAHLRQPVGWASSPPVCR